MQLLEKIAGGNCELKLLQKNCWNQGKPKCQLAIIFATCCCAGAYDNWKKGGDEM